MGWDFAEVALPKGGHVRIGRWPAATGTRGTVLILTGRCECLEKFAEFAGEWAARGWRPVAMDWRGQGGSSRFLPDRMRGHAPDFETLLDDLATALPVLIPADAPRPVIGFAHSMGGHLLTRFILERPHPFAGIVLSAPMYGICFPLLPEPALHAIVRAHVAAGKADAYAWMQKPWPALPERFEGNPFTSDPVRHRVLHDIYTANPEIALGGVTWGWLDAAFGSMRRLMRHPGLAGNRTPVLLLSAGADKVVPPERHRLLAERLAGTTLKVFPTARHELVMEHDTIRDALWREIDAWLAERAG